MTRPKSKQPRKQRKWEANAPKHKRNKLVSARLDDELSQKYKRRSLPVRKGDKVKVMRGDIRGHSGEVMRVDMTKYKIFVQGVTAKKADGTEVERPVHPSNVMIIGVFDDDKERRQVLTKKSEEK
jgi:large subunit ribosomal protein L24